MKKIRAVAIALSFGLGFPTASIAEVPQKIHQRCLEARDYLGCVKAKRRNPGLKKKEFIGIAYVSILIIAWGTFGSLIDFPLLQADIYKAGSLGQVLTFSITGFLFTYAGFKLFPILVGDKFEQNN